jgi:hypothetical protein
VFLTEKEQIIQINATISNNFSILVDVGGEWPLLGSSHGWCMVNGRGGML